MESTTEVCSLQIRYPLLFLFLLSIYKSVDKIKPPTVIRHMTETSPFFFGALRFG